MMTKDEAVASVQDRVELALQDLSADDYMAALQELAMDIEYRRAMDMEYRRAMDMEYRFEAEVT